jgi:hypothetical protein
MLLTEPVVYWAPAALPAARRFPFGSNGVRPLRNLDLTREDPFEPHAEVHNLREGDSKV